MRMTDEVPFLNLKKHPSKNPSTTLRATAAWKKLEQDSSLQKRRRRI